MGASIYLGVDFAKTNFCRWVRHGTYRILLGQGGEGKMLPYG